MDDIYFSRRQNKPIPPQPSQAPQNFDTQQLNPNDYMRQEYYNSQQDFPSPPSYPQQIPEEEFFGEPQQQHFGNAEPPAQKQPKRRKKHRLLRKLISLVIVFGIIIPACAYICVNTMVSSFDYKRGELNKNKYVNSSDLFSDKAVTNILLIGVDEELEDSARSDSMILVSIDNKYKKIKLTSFLRDSWVEIPSKGSYSKLNSACSSGGPQLLVDTIEYNFGVDIEHFVMVDFEMFKSIIDELGGVDVEITAKEAKFMNRTTHFDDFESGKSVHLDGEKALIYCRIRKLDSDYMRTFRQRKVITALIEKAKKAGISELFDAAKNVFPLIETDMNPSEITALAFKGGAALLSFDIVQSRIPTDEFCWGATSSGGQSIVKLDLEANREYLHDFIYSDKSDTEENSGDN